MKLARRVGPELFGSRSGYVSGQFLKAMVLGFVSRPVSQLVCRAGDGVVFRPGLPAPRMRIRCNRALTRTALGKVRGTPTKA